MVVGWLLYLQLRCRQEDEGNITGNIDMQLRKLERVSVLEDFYKQLLHP